MYSVDKDIISHCYDIARAIINKTREFKEDSLLADMKELISEINMVLYKDAGADGKVLLDFEDAYMNKKPELLEQIRESQIKNMIEKLKKEIPHKSAAHASAKSRDNKFNTNRFGYAKKRYIKKHS